MDGLLRSPLTNNCWKRRWTKNYVFTFSTFDSQQQSQQVCGRSLTFGKIRWKIGWRTFNPGIFNPRLSNSRPFNHEYFNHEFSNKRVEMYSLINRRQLHIFFTQAKIWHQIVCWFSWISLNSPVFAWCDHKIVLFWSAEQFYDHIMQKLGNSGKFS